MPQSTEQTRKAAPQRIDNSERDTAQTHAEPRGREKKRDCTDLLERSLEDILKAITATDKEALARIREATEKETLESIVTKERPEQEIRLDAGLRYGEQAQAYSLTVPGYRGGMDSYKVDYVAQAVQANESMTQARYDNVPDDGTECYEAAVAVQEKAIQQQKLGVAESAYAQSLEMREKAAIFKALHPREWERMYDRLKFAA